MALMACKEANTVKFPGKDMKILDGVPKGIRTPVTAVKGRCPRPLDDGDAVKASADWPTSGKLCLKIDWLSIFGRLFAL